MGRGYTSEERGSMDKRLFEKLNLFSICRRKAISNAREGEVLHVKQQISSSRDRSVCQNTQHRPVLRKPSQWRTTTSHPNCYHPTSFPHDLIHDGYYALHAASPCTCPATCSPQSRPQSCPRIHDSPSCSLRSGQPSRQRWHLQALALPRER